MELTRRQVLAGLAGAGAGVVLGSCRPAGPGGEASRAVQAARAGRAGAGTLVVVTLYGGNDGLNTVAPAADAEYRRIRGPLALAADDVLVLGEGLGLHPALTRLRARWDAGQVAIVLGVGAAELDRSHFHCMDFWQSGGSAGSGWVGRWLDRAGDGPFPAVAIGNDVPLLMRGAKRAAALVPAGGLAIAGGEQLAGAFAQLSRPYAGRPALARAAAEAGADLLALASAVAAALGGPGGEDGDEPGTVPRAGGGPGEAGGRSRGGGELAVQLDVVARLVGAGFPARVYAVSMGGFDTHANQVGTHERLLADLDAALGAFLDAVDGHGVTVGVYSEFGRRVAANASGGTDHGSAGVALVCGERVRGGLYGEPPSLRALADGDLRHAVDLRSVLGGLVEGVLGVEAADILGADAVRRHRPLALV